MLHYIFEMKEQFVNINGVPTRIRMWGKSIGEKFDKKEIILFLCGNPGDCGFYILFLTTLFKFLQGQTPIWIISHAGHDEPEDRTTKVPPLKSNKHLYDVDGQIEHKIEFIRKYIPSDVKIHLVGHSIGAYMALQLMKLNDINKRIRHCYLLFPTFEYMADTPNGKKYVHIFRNLYGIIIYRFVKLFSCLPLSIRKVIISIFCWIRSLPQEFIPHFLMILRPSVLSKVVHLADDEMKKVQAPDYDIMRQNEERFTFYYSASDDWTPYTYYKRLIEKFPNIDARLTDKFQHSFVLKSSYEMGIVFGEWIQQRNIIHEHY